MKKFLRFSGGLPGLLLVVGLAFATYTQARGMPTYPVPQVAAEPIPAATPVQLALGKELVQASCAGCHLNK